MITITAEQRILPGKEAEVDALMARLARDVLRNEPGCARFEYIVDTSDPRRRLVIEGYRDEAALALHAASGYLADFLPELLARLDGPPAVIRFADALPSVTPQSFFHTGIVVPDLEKAVRYYTATFGIEFTEPGTFSIPRLEDPDPRPFEFTAVLSRTEAPYLELIQASSDGIISAGKCGRILYHAYWENDMAARWAWATTEGPGVDAVFRMDEHSAPFSMITSLDPFGNRIEYVGTENAEPLIEWARTGVLPTGIGA